MARWAELVDTVGMDTLTCTCPADAAGPWDCTECPAHGEAANIEVEAQAKAEMDAENGWLRAAENAMEDCPEWAR